MPLGKNNSSLGQGIFICDHTAKMICDVAFKKFNVNSFFGINERCILKYCQSVTLGDQMIVEACDHVSLIRQKITVFVALGIQHFDIVHPVKNPFSSVRTEVGIAVSTEKVTPDILGKLPLSSG